MVVGVLQRGGKVRASAIDSRKKTTLQAHVKAHVKPGAEIFTDALKSYEGLNPEFVHQGDGGRFKSVVRGCGGKRLTYKRLTGKDSQKLADS